MTIDEIVDYLKAYDSKGRAVEQSFWDNEYDGEYRVENSVSIDSSKYTNAVIILFVPYDSRDTWPGKYESSHRWTFMMRDDHKCSVYYSKKVRFPQEKVVISDDFVQNQTVWKQLERTYFGRVDFIDTELTEEMIDELLAKSTDISIKEDNITYHKEK